MKVLKINLLLVLCLIFILVSCQNNAAQSAVVAEQGTVATETGEVKIEMKNSVFNPEKVTVKQGTRVTWVNGDNLSHTVTSGTRGNETGVFDSGNIGKGEMFSYTFNSSGSFDYFCKLHAGMNGTVEVK